MRVVHSSDSDSAATGAPVGSGLGVSSVEVFGFVGWITSSVAYVLYMLWAYTPAWLLESHGITYYPSKYWAVALPTWVCVTVVFVFWVYEGLCMMSAAPADDSANLHDAYTKRKEDVGMPSYFSAAGRSIPPLVDIPQEIVSMVLYGSATPKEAEEQYDRGWWQGQQQEHVEHN